MKIEMEKLNKLYVKYKEIIYYLFFGGCTTIVNFISYYVPARVFGIEEIVSNIIAWIISVLFAYTTNKIFVFESKTTTVQDLLKEMFSFIFARFFTGALFDVGLFALMLKVFHINDIITKITTQVIVVILNYICSKLIIFKKKTV
jgi:putative flippase GtrA